MKRHQIIHIRLKQESDMRHIRRRKRIEKTLHKRRTHRHIRRRTEDIQNTRQGPKTYEAIAPSIFNIGNINGVIKFLQETENICKRQKINSLKVNLDNVVEIDMYAISLMLSMLNKLSCRNIRYWGTYPNDVQCRQYIIDSGFLDIVKTNIKKPENRQKGNQIYMVGKDCVDSNRIGKSVRESMTHLVGTPTIYPPVYDNMCEISANSVEHANEHMREKNWLVSISIEGDKIHFILTDTGLGILATLRKKASQKIKDMFLKSEVDVLRDVFKKLYQSITGEINRHKGLPIIYESFEDGFISDLQVLTNKVLLDFETKQSVSLRRSFNGVLFSWTVSSNNYNKWINSL